MSCCRVVDLRCKEVINVCDGFRLGFVCDVEVETCTGRLVSIIVPGPCKFLGIFGRYDDFVIPFENILKIGDDIILIDYKMPNINCAKEKRKPFFRF